MASSNALFAILRYMFSYIFMGIVYLVLAGILGIFVFMGGSDGNRIPLKYKVIGFISLIVFTVFSFIYKINRFTMLFKFGMSCPGAGTYIFAHTVLFGLLVTLGYHVLIRPDFNKKFKNNLKNINEESINEENNDEEIIDEKTKTSMKFSLIKYILYFLFVLIYFITLLVLFYRFKCN